MKIQGALDRVQRLALQALATVLSYCPQWFLLLLARSLAWIAWASLSWRRNLILANIAKAYRNKPEVDLDEQRKIGFESLEAFILTVLEFFSMPPPTLGARVKICGRENLLASLGQGDGRGVYILCAHLGNWEAMASALTQQVAPAHVVVKPVGGATVDQFLTERRRAQGFFPIQRGEKGSSARAIAQAISVGEIVGFAMDQARPGSTALPFFGAMASTNTSLAALWLRQKAPILPAYIRRTGFGQHEIIVGEPLELRMRSTDSETILALSEQFNQAVERMILANPRQYFWAHNRYKWPRSVQPS